jgi:hypothetical protein
MMTSQGNLEKLRNKSTEVPFYFVSVGYLMMLSVSRP